MADVELKRKVTLKRKGDEKDTSKPPKSQKWQWLLLSIVAIAIVFFLVKNDSSDDSAGMTKEQPVSTPADETTVGIEETTVPEDTATPATEPAQSSQPAVKPETADTLASTLPQGTVEEKARKVIRGDFGNGAERKQKLGSEYKEIQQRVNKMYRNGTF